MNVGSLRIEDKDLQKYFQAVKLKTAKFYIKAAVALFVIGGAVNAQGAGSNLSLADSVYTSALDSLLNEISEPILKIHDSASEDRTFLRSGWIQYWASAGTETDRDSSKYLFVIDRFGIDIAYFENSTRLFGFNTILKRRLSFFLQGWLENSASGKVVRSFSVHKKEYDLVDADRLSSIEKSPFRFTKGTMKTKSAWMHYIEPGVVIAAASVIVYLFFSVRT